MFQFDRDLLIEDAQLWLDSQRVREFGYISHAHGDHIARHKKIICSPATADLAKKRLKNPFIQSLEFGEVVTFNDSKISLHPAGHILGSSQIRIEQKDKTLLYSGDFRLEPSRTAEPFEFVKTDILIMESTFGLPHYQVPPRAEVEEQLVDLCRKTLQAGKVPVVYAYALGKGQEALHLLTEAGLPVAADYSLMRYIPVYEKYGVQFGSFEKFRRSDFRGKVLLVPPGFRFRRYFKELENSFSIYLSGWGIDKTAQARLGVDKVLPMSDHADFNELLRLAETLKPSEIYCTHGFDQFVTVLKNAGYNAKLLKNQQQTELALD